MPWKDGAWIGEREVVFWLEVSRVVRPQDFQPVAFEFFDLQDLEFVGLEVEFLVGARRGRFQVPSLSPMTGGIQRSPGVHRSSNNSR